MKDDDGTMQRNTSPWIDHIADERRFSRLEGNATADIAVVGAGIVGTLTAWQLRRRGLKVALLEKNHVATGDTGATTGFLTKVPDTSLVALAAAQGDEYVRKAFSHAAAAQKEVFGLIKEQGIACAFAPCSAYYGAYGEGDPVLAAERPHFERGWPGAAHVKGTDIPGLPFYEAMRVPDEGRFDVRQFIFDLLGRMKGPGFDVYEESEVTDIVFDETGALVKTERGSVAVKKVVLATGLPIDAFSELRGLLHPSVTYVIKARFKSLPLPDDVYWDTLDPYFYYRKSAPDELILGGCDVDAKDAGSATDAHGRLEKFMRDKFGDGYEITNRWSGSIFHSHDGLPYVFSDARERGRAIIAMGFGGNGMVFGALAARTIADLATGEQTGRTALLSPSRAGIIIPPRPVRAAVPEGKAFVAVAKASELAGGRLCRATNGRSLIITKDGETLRAVEARCTHQGGDLCAGTFEGKTVQCPLHGARFDISTGAVLGPPAARPLRSFAVRQRGDDIEVELPSAGAATAPPLELSPIEKREKSFASLLRFSACTASFWGLQFAYQYLAMSKGDLGSALVRSFSFTGATLISFALFSSALFKWRPALAVHWRTRRRLGVSGVISITAHILAVSHFFFGDKPLLAFSTLDPFKNPIVFGAVAYPLFFMMAVTSTDWAFEKLTPKRWKLVHRVSYFAYWAAVFHFMTVNPSALLSPPGYLLVAAASAALFGQLFWYVRIAGAKRFRTVGGLVGAILILLYVAAALLALKARGR